MAMQWGSCYGLMCLLMVMVAVEVHSFSAGEHVLICQTAWDEAVKEEWFPKTLMHGLEEIKIESGQLFSFGEKADDIKAKLSFGEIAALMGDFVGDVKQGPLGELKSAQMEDTVKQINEKIIPVLKQLKSGSLGEEIKQLLPLIKREIDLIQSMEKDTSSSRHFVEKYYKVNEKNNVLFMKVTRTGGKADLEVAESFKKVRMLIEGLRGNRYVELMKENIDHFGTYATRTWSLIHLLAIAHARNNLLEAIVYEAAAAHFLTDLFSTGHMRTPRGELQKNCAAGPAGAIFSGLMHNEDNIYGLKVKSAAHPEPWMAFGDKALFSRAAGGMGEGNAHFRRVVDAVKAGLQDLTEAQDSVPISKRKIRLAPVWDDPTKNNPDHMFRSLFHIPEVVDEKGQLPAMFKIDGKTIMQRQSSPRTQPPRYEKVSETCLKEMLVAVKNKGLTSKCYTKGQVDDNADVFELGDGDCEHTNNDRKKSKLAQFATQITDAVTTCSGDGECAPMKDEPCKDECSCGKNGINQCKCIRKMDKDKPSRPCVAIEEL